jgi:hypothetical protein
MLIYVPDKGDIGLIELDARDEDEQHLIRLIIKGLVSTAQLANSIRQLLPADAFSKDLKRYTKEVNRQRPVMTLQ